ncbi:hypothetical protein [Seonamhaeicola sp.]|uniref:hypothetical protein n=1 Tax=Seonamhaeicola sp. TaxID=1912245 RepID=UPI002613C10C|nr:hypothetical protein [Seonamhaeicola sp.]
MKNIKNISITKVLMLTVVSVALVGCGGVDDLEPVFPQEEEMVDPGEPQEIPEVKSVINFENPKQLIDVFYYDVKQGNRVITSLDRANEIYNIDDANGMRIPIFGNIGSPAHPSEGVVVESEYAAILTSIDFAKQVRGNRPFSLFASKKLENQNSFPAWVKDANGIIPAKYAILIADFIEFMNSKGHDIEYLGIDNEFVFNEGKISPQKYIDTIDELKLLAVARGFEMPVLVGYEDFGPDKRNWVQNLLNLGGGDKMEIYGTHYYPEFRPYQRLLNDLSLIGDTPFWSTEPHWDSKNNVDDLNEAEAALVTLWQQTDNNMSGFMWWNYEINNGIRSKLMRMASVPLLGARPIDISDIDGKEIIDLGKLSTRAFMEDNTITVYAVNFSGDILQNYGFQLEGASIKDGIEAIQWTDISGADGESSSLSALGDSNDIFGLTLPNRSITRFVFTKQ